MEMSPSPGARGAVGRQVRPTSSEMKAERDGAGDRPPAEVQRPQTVRGPGHDLAERRAARLRPVGAAIRRHLQLVVTPCHAVVGVHEMETDPVPALEPGNSGPRAPTVDGANEVGRPVDRVEPEAHVRVDERHGGDPARIDRSREARRGRRRGRRRRRGARRSHRSLSERNHTPLSVAKKVPMPMTGSIARTVPTGCGRFSYDHWPRYGPRSGPFVHDPPSPTKNASLLSDAATLRDPFGSPVSLLHVWPRSVEKYPWLCTPSVQTRSSEVPSSPAANTDPDGSRGSASHGAASYVHDRPPSTVNAIWRARPSGPSAAGQAMYAVVSEAAAIAGVPTPGWNREVVVHVEPESSEIWSSLHGAPTEQETNDHSRPPAHASESAWSGPVGGVVQCKPPSVVTSSGPSPYATPSRGLSKWMWISPCCRVPARRQVRPPSTVRTRSVANGSPPEPTRPKPVFSSTNEIDRIARASTALDGKIVVDVDRCATAGAVVVRREPIAAVVTPAPMTATTTAATTTRSEPGGGGSGARPAPEARPTA